MLDEAFTKKGLTELQVEAYGIALDDLTDHEIEIGCNRALRHWNIFSAIPTPAFIRECVAGALEEERAFKPRPKEIPIRRMTVEEAWDDWEFVQQIQKEMFALIGVVSKTKQLELKKVYGEDLVLATNERVAELKRQAKLMEEKYGQGK